MQNVQGIVSISVQTHIGRFPICISVSLNIYNLPFSRTPNMGKIRVKVEI